MMLREKEDKRSPTCLWGIFLFLRGDRGYESGDRFDGIECVLLWYGVV